MSAVGTVWTGRAVSRSLCAVAVLPAEAAWTALARNPSEPAVRAICPQGH